MTADEELKEVLEAVEAWMTALLRLSLGTYALKPNQFEKELEEARERLIQAMIVLSKAM